MSTENVIILGAGPAGYTAAIYAARAGLKPLLLTGQNIGGQLASTTDVENFPGFARAISGPDLMIAMHQQAEHVGARILQEVASAVQLTQNPLSVTTTTQSYTTRTLIIATGASARWLNIPSEEPFKNFGISSCATCDGFFYRGKEVCVVGGGNSAVEEALYLASIASKVTLIHRRNTLRAEEILQEKLKNNPKIVCIWDSAIEEFLGQHQPRSLTGIRIKNIKTQAIQEIKTDAVFIAIGHDPATKIFTGSPLTMDSEGYIITTPGSTLTSVQGVFAAGDVADKHYRQAVTAAGTGCMAALDVQKYLATLS